MSRGVTAQWHLESSDGDQAFEVEREVGKTGNDERLAFLEVLQRAIRENQMPEGRVKAAFDEKPIHSR
jgi:hypothetical protein